MKKTQYFKTETFVENVIDALNLHDEHSSYADGLREVVRDTLRTRLLAVMFDKFSDREMALFEQMQDDHPELESLDTLMMMIHNIDWLESTLEEAINDLHAELIDYAQKMHAARQSYTDDIVI